MPFTPTTLDLTNGQLFKYQFDKIPHVDYFAYSVNLPGITGGEIIQPSPLLDIKIAGDKLIFDPLVINFIVNEDLKNYIEIQDWMFGIYKPLDTTQYRNQLVKNPNLTNNQNKYGNCTLFILSNKQNPIVKVTFHDCFPTALSPLQFDSSITDAVAMTCDVTLSYFYYTIEPVT